MNTRSALFEIKKGGVALLCFFMASVGLPGQNLVLNDSLNLFPLNNIADPGTSLVKFRCTQDFSYTVAFSNLMFINWQRDQNSNQICFLQHLNYRFNLTSGGSFNFSNIFIHDLGFQLFFDSISRFRPDDNSLETRIGIALGKNFTFSFRSVISTRFFNAYDYESEAGGGLVKKLNASFMTPLRWTFSTGFGWTFPAFLTIDLGISAAKLTYIHNKEVYEQLDLLTFYGVLKEKKYLFEYGLTMHLLIDKAFLKKFSWNCDLLLFKNYEKPLDLDMKNLIGIRINKFLKTSIQTRLYYEEEASPKLQVENLITLGFFVSL